jgi:hypothetical protein
LLQILVWRDAEAYDLRDRSWSHIQRSSIDYENRP